MADPATSLSKLSDRQQIENFIGSPSWASCRFVVDRFLYALFWFGKRHPESFHVVETIRGATKPYFSKSAKRFINGGRSGNPRNIPGTRYWVSTDCSTKRKVQIIDRVMKTLGYAKNDIARVTAKLVPEGNARGVQLEMSGLDREELPDQI